GGHRFPFRDLARRRALALCRLRLRTRRSSRFSGASLGALLRRFLLFRHARFLLLPASTGSPDHTIGSLSRHKEPRVFIEPRPGGVVIHTRPPRGPPPC